MNKTLALWTRFSRWPLGPWLFSQAVCRRAPYFATVRPRIVSLQPNRCEALIRKRRRVQNHIGTVHVIAISNGLELAMGVMAEASIPAHLRWIPKGMTLRYTAKADSDIRVIAELPDDAWEHGPDVQVPVRALRADDTVVVEGEIHLWVTEKPPKT